MSRKWNVYPHARTGFDYAEAALRKNWARLHRGDCEPFPSADWVAETFDAAPAAAKSAGKLGADPERVAAELQEAWRAFHRGDYQAACEKGLALGVIGHTVADKAASMYATFLEPDKKARLALFGHKRGALCWMPSRNITAVLPVLGIWSDWNDGSNGETWHLWEKNPFNATLNGPAKRPGDLLDDTPCRQLWFQRLETLVKHWAPRRCIVGWEILSEVDLISGATEDRAVEFTARAAAVVRAADPAHRPITVSQAGVNAMAQASFQ